MKKILVPTDFSEHANTEHWHLPLILPINLGVRLLYCIPIKFYSSTGSFVSVGSYMEEDAAQANARIG